MSIFDIFTSTPATQAPPQQQAGTPTTPGAIPEPNIPIKEGDGTTPPEPPTTPPEPPKDDSPLAAFAGLWDTNGTGEGQQPNPASQPINPEDVNKALENVDFTSSISPDHLQAIAAGGEDAQKAFVSALGNVAKTVMGHSILVNDRFTKQAVENAIQETRKQIPDLIRSQSSNEHLRNSNPLFDNPAVKPVIAATRSQLLQKYPDATNEQITDMTHQFVEAIAKSFGPQPETTTPGEDGQDWTKFITG